MNQFLRLLCALLWIPAVSRAQSPTYGLYNVESLGPAAIVAADFNGDGKMDFAVTSSKVQVYLSNGDGTFQQPKNFAVGQFTLDMVAGDFNGDGKVDLIAANVESKDLSVLLGNGDGTFRTAVSHPVDGYPGRLVAADLNGDGKLDLAVTLAVTNGGPGILSILLGHGDGTFGAASSQSLGVGLIGIAAADFNGDGKLDLATVELGTLWLLQGKGDGTFGTPKSVPIEGRLGGIASGDFNGDGRVDLVVTSHDSPSVVYVLLGKGDGSFQTPTALQAAGGPIAVTLGDFNADGKLDMAVANNDKVPLQNDVSLLLGNGDGTFAPPVFLAAGNNPFDLVAADWNGDGKLDLAVANNGSQFVSLLIAGFPPGLSSFTTVSAADGSPGLAPESLVSAYAPGISGYQQSASLPIPTTLAGLSIEVKDRAGVSRLAPMLFASPVPSQINFQIPAGTQAGAATLTIWNGTASAMVEPVVISPVAPALFSANATGKGVAAALAVSVSRSNSVQTPVAVFHCDPQTGCSAAPIVLSADSRVYVSLFGTGIRGAGGSSNVTCRIHGVYVPVQYAGAQPAFLGLDQVNVVLPLSLRGSGESEVTLTTGGRDSNAVLLNIQ